MSVFGFLKKGRKSDAPQKPVPASSAPPARRRPSAQAESPAARAKVVRSIPLSDAPPLPTSKPAQVPAPAAAAKPPAPPRTAPPPVVPVKHDGATDLPEVDALFAGGFRVVSIGADGRDTDVAAIRQLFKEIAGQQSAPVRDFMAELRRGTATKDWIEVCQPIMQTLVDAATSSGLPEEAAAMRRLLDTFTLTAAGSDRTIDPTARKLILEAYESVTAELPDAFPATPGASRSEAIVLHALLKQVPDVGRVTFERLFGAGLTTIGALLQSTSEDLAGTTGIPSWLAERICAKVAEHRAEQRDHGVADGRPGRLGALLAEMKAKHAAYERAAEAESTDASLASAKRTARQTRQVCALKIEVALAEMGELALVESFQKSSFDQKIRELEAFVLDASRKGR